MPLALLAVDLRGLVNVAIIVVVAAIIAFIGDRVGHRVGRLRMTIFGLRPRYTSTLFAVVWGIGIALFVVGLVSFFSKDARQALFSISKLNDEITSLTQQRERLVQFMREEPIVFANGQPLTQPVIVRSTDSLDSIERTLALLFVYVANEYRSVPGVQPYPKDPLTPARRARVGELAKRVKSFEPQAAIVVPQAGQNIFRGDEMSITFAVYPDKLIYRRGEIISSAVVADGRNLDADRSALLRLLLSIRVNAVNHGMPPSIADNPTTTGDAADRALAALTHTAGPAVLRAVAPTDIFAQGPLTTELVAAPKTS